MTPVQFPKLNSQTFQKRLESGAQALSELLEYKQWVVWRYVLIGSKWKKPPINPITGNLAKTTDSSTWATFDKALNALAKGVYHGIGFVFSENDPFTGTDLDHCIQEDGTIEKWAFEYIRQLNSYTEFSPSRTGLHILTKARLPGPGKKKGKVEMYSTARFFTITGDHLVISPSQIQQRGEIQSELYKSLIVSDFERGENSGWGAGQMPYTLSKRSDAQIIQKAMKARNGATFRSLWEGNSEGYSSKSEADFALVLLLLYWTDDDANQTDRLFRQSKLMSDKWDSSSGKHTYAQLTIHNARKKRRL